MGCCSEINLYSHGNALKKQGDRFGKYEKIGENDENGYFIYQYQNETVSSTLMRDLRSSEWKVYNGHSITPKSYRQVITSECFTECAGNCTNSTFKYLDGDNFILDDTIKLECVIPDETNSWILIVIGLVVCVTLLALAAALIWYLVVKRQLCKKDHKENEPENFTVQINEYPELYKELKLPEDEYPLKASCKINNVDVERQPLAYEYKWTYNRDRNDIIGHKKQYLAKNLEEGDHEYTALVNCGSLKRQSTAKVKVLSVATVNFTGIRKKDKLYGVKAEVGKKMWINSNEIISNLPQCLNNAVLVQLPYDIVKDESAFEITVHEKSTVYFAQISSEQNQKVGGNRSRRGWPSEYMNTIQFKEVEDDKVETQFCGNLSCTLSLHMKTIGKNDFIRFKDAETDTSLAAIFIKKGDHPKNPLKVDDARNRSEENESCSQSISSKSSSSKKKKSK